MANVGVTFDFAAESAKLRSEIDKVRREMSSLNATAKGIASGFKMVGAAIVGAFSVTAITSFLRTAAQAADQLNDLSGRLQASASGLQTLQLAAGQAGGSAEAMNTALAKLSVTIGDGLAGNKAAVEAFQKLGLTAAELAGLKADEAMQRVAAALSGVGNSYERAAIAQDIFGKGAAELAGFFADAPGAIGEVNAALAAAGATLDDIDVAKLGLMNDQLALQGQVVQNLGIKFTANLSPAIGVAVESFAGLLTSLGGASEAGRGFGTIMVAAIKAVEAAVYGLIAVFEGARATVAGLLTVMVSGVSGILDAIAQAAEAVGVPFAGSLRSAADASQSWAEGLNSVAKSAAANAASAGAAAIKAATDIFNAGTIFDQKAAEFERRAAEAAARAQGPQGAPGTGVGGTYTAVGNATAVGPTSLPDVKIAENERLLGIEAEYQDARLALIQRAEETILGLVFTSAEQQRSLEAAKYLSFNDLLQNYLQSAAAGNGRLAKIAKALSLAQAIWNTATGVTKALSIQDYAGAAKIAAAGAIQIATIRSTNYTDSGNVTGGKGTTGGLPSPSLGNNVPGLSQSQDTGKSVAQVVIQGNVFSAQETVDWLVEQLREAVSSRDVVFINGNSRQAMELTGA